ncbi:hypothetical protein Pfo_015918 [Paulownia fortunei]|nr:hypothetical protein Pfo_015918 [Paulownia fortunei]
MDREFPVETQPGKGYAFSEKIMLTAGIVALFFLFFFLAGLHIYARWYLRQRRVARTHIVLYANNHHGTSAVDRGLEPAVLNSLPVFLYSSKAAEQPPLECAVCLSEFEENEVGRLLPKCNHSFHIECINMWFHSHSTCPLCRSPVEPVENRNEPSSTVVEAAEEVSGSEPSSSSGSGLCAMCQHEDVNGNANVNTTSLGGRRKANGGIMGVRIEVAPPRLELENELTQTSPGTRLLSLKRLLSMSKKSPVGSGKAPPHGAGTSRGATELDLESGLSDPVRVHTPR